MKDSGSSSSVVRSGPSEKSEERSKDRAIFCKSPGFDSCSTQQNHRRNTKRKVLEKHKQKLYPSSLFIDAKEIQSLRSTGLRTLFFLKSQTHHSLGPDPAQYTTLNDIESLLTTNLKISEERTGCTSTLQFQVFRIISWSRREMITHGFDLIGVDFGNISSSSSGSGSLGVLAFVLLGGCGRCCGGGCTSGGVSSGV